MALQPCRECGDKVSTEATTCPHCGTPRPTVPTKPTSAGAPPPSPAPSRAGQMASTALGWLVGGVLALAALGALFTNLLGGVLFALAAAAVLPPVNSWLKRTLNLSITSGAKAWIVMGLLVGGSFAIARGVTEDQEREAARATDARAKALRADFAANGPTILSRIDSALSVHNYPLAVSIGEKYTAAVSDSQLARRLRDAHAGQKRIADQAREQQLVARVQRIPPNSLETNRDLYQQLAALNPTNASYKAKYDDFNNRIRQRDAAEHDRIRQFGPVPQASAWDGTYHEVEEYLRDRVNDPDKFKMDACTPVYHVATGWLVGCDWRGANGFGAIMRQTNWFIIRQGRVVEMKEANAYRP